MKQVEVAIIGGGPAGISAAIELARGGASLIVIDSYPQPGGHYFRRSPQEFGPDASLDKNRGAEYRSLDATMGEQHIEILSGTTVWSVFQDEETAVFTLHLQGHHDIRAIEAKYLLLAPGSYDRPLPFPGWHLPGVITLGGAQMLLKGHGVLPGKRILVAGGGPLLLASAAGLIKAGAEVVAVLDIAPAMGGFFKMPRAFLGQGKRIREALEYRSALKQKRVPLLFGHTVFRAIGEEEVSAAAYGKLDSEGRPIKQGEKMVDVDTICVSLGFLPNLALTRHLGCEHFYDQTLDAFYPEHDNAMQTTVPNVFVAGDVTGVGGKDLSQLQGEVAGINILGDLGHLGEEAIQRQMGALLPKIDREKRFAHMMRDRMNVRSGLLDLMDDDTIVCRCEMVTVGNIKTAVNEGARDLRGAKLRTRCGMGACQSRYCEQTVGSLLARETGQPREAVGTASIRPPIVPVLVKDLLQ